MAPRYYRDARLEARDHIQARLIERRGSTLRVEVVKVFRGCLRTGSVIELHVSLASDGPVVLDGTIGTPAAVADDARFIEAFLDGDPPEIVRDQIKFLEQRTAQPSGDPTRESYLW